MYKEGYDLGYDDGYDSAETKKITITLVETLYGSGVTSQVKSVSFVVSIDENTCTITPTSTTFSYNAYGNTVKTGHSFSAVVNR